MIMLASSVLLSAFFAGLVATGVTLAIERWGGLLGGVLGTVPSTIVPAAAGMQALARPATIGHVSRKSQTRMNMAGPNFKQRCTWWSP